MINNPYIEKVKVHPKIITSTEEIYKHTWKWNLYFWNNHPIILEIGTGLGNFFSGEVAKNPENNYIGMEIKYKRCFMSAEKSIAKWGEHFVILKDYWENTDKIFEENEVDQTHIFFPDPWAKKDKQRKHRLLQKEFLKNLYNITKKWGKLILKTDHRWYFDDTLELFEELGLWKEKRKSFHYEKDIKEFDKTNITEFEQIFRGQKLEICYIELIK